MFYDTGKLASELGMELVCESLGIEMFRHGINTFIPCPEHVERTHDNCAISKNDKRYICYACGASGDIFDLIKNTQNVDFSTAVRIAAEISGCPECFTSNSSEKRSFCKILSYEDCKFLGIKNGPVYGLRSITPMYVNANNIISEDIGTDYYLYANREVILKNPLRTLLETNKDAYDELIRNKAREKIEILKEIGEALNANVYVQPLISKAAHLLIEHGGTYEIEKDTTILAVSAAAKPASALF